MEIRALADADFAAAASVAAAAFAADPAFRHVTRDCPALLKPLFDAELRVDRAAAGHMLGAFAPRLLGLAVWFAPGHRAPSLSAWLAQLPSLWPFALGAGAALRGWRMQREVEAERAGHRRAAYLRLLAVAPEAQGRGAGAELVGRAAGEAEADLYLETSRESNIAFYRRRGFTLMRKVEPAGMPPFWSMLRRK